jgi:hypothetical protein
LTKAETFTAAIQIMAKIMNSMAAKRWSRFCSFVVGSQIKTFSTSSLTSRTKLTRWVPIEQLLLQLNFIIIVACVCVILGGE